ncbi:MAG: hypothetical protein H7301_01475 [Cryobacterium sp.]|nr:hypothetical protein [Oligoflexia bacterium]
MNSQNSSSPRSGSKNRKSSPNVSLKSSNGAARKSVSRKTADRDGSWLEGVQTEIQSFDQQVTHLITARPVVSLAIAVGLGGLAFFVAKKISSELDENSSFRKGLENVPSHFSENLSQTLTRFEGEFDSLGSSSLSDVRDNIVQMITDDLSEKPFETLLTAASLGFGMGTLRFDDVKDVALRLAKKLAMQSIDGMASNSMERNSRSKSPSIRERNTLRQ